MKVIQVSAKNVEKAIEQGLKELGKSQEEVDIKILDEGGFLRKAKVELYFDDGQPDVTPVKEETKKAPKEEKPKKEKAVKEDKKQEAAPAKQAKLSVEDFCTAFLKTLCEKMQIKAEISYTRMENAITFNASGDDVSALIGKHGETLNAIQEVLVNVAKNAGYKGEKLYFDVENYKNRREISLISLGEKMAEKAKKIGKPIKLERMNAYERKIIHTALSSIEGVTTHSEGEEPNRYLVIIPEEKE